jgi:hypothetical protein
LRKGGFLAHRSLFESVKTEWYKGAMAGSVGERKISATGAWGLTSACHIQGGMDARKKAEGPLVW